MTYHHKVLNTMLPEKAKLFEFLELNCDVCISLKDLTLKLFMLLSITRIIRASENWFLGT